MRSFIFLILSLVVSGQVLADSHLYVVKENETLTSILRALNYGETYGELLPYIDEIVQQNPAAFPGGNANFVIPGSTITLPGNPNQAKSTPVAEPESTPEPTLANVSTPLPESEIPSIGRLRAATGRIGIHRENETITINGIEDLYARDVIFTQQGALAEITLLDNTRILMGPSSEFTVSEYRFAEPTSQDGKTLGALVASLGNGIIRIISGLIGQFSENRFQIKSTLTATIDIRNSDLTVRSCNQVTDCGDLYGVAVAVQDGSISLKNQVAEIELKQNEFARVQSATDTPVPAPVPEGFFDLRRDVKEIEVSRSWWQKATDYIKHLF